MLSDLRPLNPVVTLVTEVHSYHANIGVARCKIGSHNLSVQQGVGVGGVVLFPMWSAMLKVICVTVRYIFRQICSNNGELSIHNYIVDT